jgi:hypothetical protein
MKVSTQGPGGGAPSQMQTALSLKFPANREINREFYDFLRFGDDIRSKNPCAAVRFEQIPYGN